MLASRGARTHVAAHRVEATIQLNGSVLKTSGSLAEEGMGLPRSQPTPERLSNASV